MTTDKIMSLADDYATAFGVFSETRIERRETLRTEIEKLVRDAERYRWLRATTNWASSNGERINVKDQPELWDNAIDAAMEKQS